MRKFIAILLKGIKNHKLLIVLNLLFIANILYWIYILPFNSAPDEAVHFNFNIKFLIENGRLPISGIDDLNAYNNVRENQFGKISIINSYVIYPRLNYIISTITAILLYKVLYLPYYIGARVASLIWGVIYLNALYFCVYHLTSNRKLAALFTLCFGFIPQIMYISSYINQDIHSLAISALLALALIKLVRNRSRNNMIFFGISFGMLLSAKYNYFALIPLIVVMFVYFYKKGILSKKELFNTSICSIGLGVIISGVWYIRNFILYHDFLGQSFMLEKANEFHPSGVVQDFNYSTIVWLIKNGYFSGTFKSFFALFDYMTVGFDNSTYSLLFFSFSIILIMFIFEVYLTKDKEHWIPFIIIFPLYIVVAFGLFLYNSFEYDLQGQGRYLFNLIIPFVICIAWIVNRHKNLLRYVMIFASIIIIILFRSNILLTQSYGKAQIKPYKLEDVVQEDVSTNVGNIVGSSLTQSFVAKNNSLCEIDLYMATFKRTNNGIVEFSLNEYESNKIVYNKALPMEEICDNTWVVFKFNPLSDCAGRKYNISLKCVSNDVNDTITLWSSADDVYKDGELLINDSRINKDISFRTFYRP